MQRLLGIGCLLLSLLLLLGSGCAPRPSYFAYAELAFRAEVRGSLGGEDFCAAVERRSDPASDGGAALVRVEYLSGASLAGISVLASEQPDPASVAVASLGELSLEVLRQSVEGWLMPVDCLLELPDLPIESVRREEDGFLLTFSDGALLRVDQKGMPLSLKTADLDLEVVWLEPFS